MGVSLVSSNVVIVARQFNPSVMSQLWLVKHGLVGEEDFEQGCVFSDALVQVRTKTFSLLVVPEQFQFVPQVESQEEQRLIVEKVGFVVSRLPHTPFSAVGLNFVWHITADEGEADVRKMSRRMFFKEENPLYRHFDTEDAKFGAYLSKDTLGTRLKLDIKPVTLVESKEERLHFGFNYHLELATGDPVSEIGSMLQRWDEARADSLAIVQSSQAGE